MSRKIVATPHLPFSRLWGEHGRVLFLERDPDTLALLCRNLAGNQCHNVTPHLSAEAGVSTMAVIRFFTEWGSTISVVPESEDNEPVLLAAGDLVTAFDQMGQTI